MNATTVLPAAVRRSYLRKFAVVIGVVLLVSAGFGIYAQQQVSTELTHEVHAQMETVAELEADALHEWLVENEQTVRMLSEFGAFTSGTSAELQATMTHELEQLPESTQAIHYVDLSTGEIRESTEDGAAGTTLGERDLEWAHESPSELLAGDSSAVAVSEGYEHGGTELVAFLSKVEGTSKAVMMTVDVTERADHFRNPIEGGYTYVVNSAGTIEIAASSEKALTAYRGGANSRALQAGLDGEHGVVERDATGEVVAYAPVKGTDWVVLAHAPQSNAYVLREAVQRDLLVMLGISLAGFLLVALTLGRDTVRSLDDLSEKARALASGRVDVEVPDEGRLDEVGEVRSAFRDVQSYLDTTTDQASAIADQDFDDPALQEDVPGALGESLETMRHDLEEFITELEQAKENARQSQEEAETLARELKEQATQFGNVMERAADGDFTQRLDTDIDNDSMRDIADAFNEMLAQLETTVVEVRAIANGVDDLSTDVSAGAEEVQNASQEVSESVQEISAGADEQNENIQQVADEMTDLSATVEEIASSSDEVASKSAQAANLGEQGSTYATEAVEEMTDIERQAEETIGEVEQLNEEMERIGEIVDLIDEIAEQTNMLALNASIEAARAGEAGEGFGVVADEIKGLAEETGQATQEIEQLITDVQESTARAVEDMQAMGERVQSGRETVDRAASTLEEIIDQVEDANAGVQSINDATDEQAASTEEVVAMVDEIGTISEQTSDEAESVAAAAEEQTASMSEITDNIVSLSNRATQLRELTDEFEVDEGTSTGTTDAGGAEPLGNAAADDADRPSMTADGGTD